MERNLPEIKLPYYMAYPVPFLFSDDKREERDYEYLRSLYPEMAKRILPYVMEECDRLEYDGSMIYDEYPDKLQLRLMCRRVYDRILDEEDIPELSSMALEEEAQTQSQALRPRRRRSDPVRDTVEILLFQELLRRRGQERRRRECAFW